MTSVSQSLHKAIYYASNSVQCIVFPLGYQVWYFTLLRPRDSLPAQPASHPQKPENILIKKIDPNKVCTQELQGTVREISRL